MWRSAGAANTALVEQFTTNSGNAGSIVIAFQNGAFDNAKIDGIEILQPGAAAVSSSVQISSGGKGSGSFVADEFFSGGNAATVTSSIDTSLALFPAPTAVYQGERWGNVTYTIPNLTPGGSYWVRLHFAETYWYQAGNRVFNVAINGATVLSNFDIVAASGGAARAISQQFTAAATSSGRIVIQLSNGTADNAKIDGIEVLSAAPTGVDANLLISSGGAAAGSFSADSNFSGGTAATTAASISTTGLVNPAPLGVYQSERWGVFSYTFNNLAPGSAHTVRLHFAEFYWTAVGQRTFSITANGTTVLSNYDIIKAAGGANKATIVQFVTTADQNGSILLNFLKTGADNPKVDGVEIH